jgi:hypothetical protein
VDCHVSLNNAQVYKRVHNSEQEMRHKKHKNTKDTKRRSSFCVFCIFVFFVAHLQMMPIGVVARQPATLPAWSLIGRIESLGCPEGAPGGSTLYRL